MLTTNSLQPNDCQKKNEACLNYTYYISAALKYLTWVRLL